MINGVAHVAINVTDMEKSLEFYCNKLGFKKAFEIFDDKENPWIVYVKICDNTFIELFYNGVKDREEAYSNDVCSYHHFCIASGDIDTLAKNLYDKNIIKEPKAGLGQDLNKNIWIHDPDGNAVEFVEYSKQSPHMKSNSTNYNVKGDLYKGIGHVAFVVSDMDKAMKFYSEQLGFKIIFQLEDEEGKPWINYLKICDGTYIELFYGGVKPNPVVSHSAGFQHLCILCDDVYKTVDQLIKLGVTIDVLPSQGKDKNYQAWIRDSEGNRIELMTIDKDSPQAKS